MRQGPWSSHKDKRGDNSFFTHLALYPELVLVAFFESYRLS